MERLKSKPKVLLTNSYDRAVVADALAGLRRLADVTDSNRSRNLTLDEIRQAIPGAHAVIAADEPYPREVFADAGDLLLVARDGAGYDKIDLQAATDHGVVITRAPVVIDATANLTIGLMIALIRRIPLADRAVRENRWTDRSLFLCPDLTPMTLGIVGFGAVGRKVAERAAALGMKLLTYDSADVSEAAQATGAKIVSLEELLSQSDVVSIHLCQTPQTKGLFCAKTFRQMKEGAYLLNTSRGGIVVEADLIDVLESGHLVGAALDVFAEEPVDPRNPLLTMDNVLLSPHLAGDTTTTMIEATRMNVAQITDLFAGSKPSHMLNPEVWGKARIHRFLRS